MKKISYFIILLSSILLFSCTPQEENLFDESTANRVDAALASHKEILMGAENGWLMEFFPARGQTYGGYNLLTKFTNDDVIVAGEQAAALESSEGLYSLKYSAGPVMTFDSYNEIMHFYSDPNGSVSGIGGNGKGMEGDFEFLVLKATKDSVILKGKKTENKIIMTPFPKEKKWSDYIEEIQDAAEIMKNRSYNYEINGKTIPVAVNYRTLTFQTTNESGVKIDQKASYIQTTTGYKLYSPITIEGLTVDEFIYNESTDTFSPSNGGNALLRPFIPPLNVLFTSSDWYFKYSGFGSYGKTYWNHVKTNFMDPMGEEIYYAYLGNDSGGKWGFNFTSYDGAGLYGGALYMNRTLVGENKITMNFALAGSGDGVWYHNNAGFSFILNPLGYSVARTFTLTTDNEKNPTWIKMTDDSDPTNTFVLEGERVIYPYRN